MNQTNLSLPPWVSRLRNDADLNSSLELTWLDPNARDALREQWLGVWNQVPYEEGFHAECRQRLARCVPLAVTMSYVDGFVIAVPKQNIEAYKKMARVAAEVWKEHGALAYVENIADDVPYGKLTSFPRAVQAKDDEVVCFSWILYSSREQRDETNAKVMADPRLKGMMNDTPFDAKRMIYGGFKTFLER